MYAVIGNLNSICEQELTTEPVGILFWKISTFIKDSTAFIFGVQTL